MRFSVVREIPLCDGPLASPSLRCASRLPGVNFSRMPLCVAVVRCEECEASRAWEILAIFSPFSRLLANGIHCCELVIDIFHPRSGRLVIERLFRPKPMVVGLPLPFGHRTTCLRPWHWFILPIMLVESKHRASSLLPRLARSYENQNFLAELQPKRVARCALLQGSS